MVLEYRTLSRWAVGFRIVELWSPALQRFFFFFWLVLVKSLIMTLDIRLFHSKSRCLVVVTNVQDLYSNVPLMRFDAFIRGYGQLH